MNQPNWGLLIEQGRAKAYGIPWSDKEAIARYSLGIPAEYVRDGCLTTEQYEKAKSKIESGEKPLRYWNKPELLEKARKLGLVFTDETTKRDLIDAIVAKQKLDLPVVQ